MYPVPKLPFDETKGTQKSRGYPMAYLADHDTSGCRTQDERTPRRYECDVSI